jgi:hypothetical protein
MAMRHFMTLGGLAAAVMLWGGAASAGQVAKGNNFVVNANVAACHPGAECKIELQLQAVGEFHVNKEYPYKFKAADAAGVEYLGRDPAGKNVFSKAAGDFALNPSNEKVGTMTLKFKAAHAGNVTIAGQFKLSVCSAANCMLETAEVSVPVAVH